MSIDFGDPAYWRRVIAEAETERRNYLRLAELSAERITTAHLALEELEGHE